jgi:ribosome-binding protein aMBF1 (putative translation factor)
MAHGLGDIAYVVSDTAALTIEDCTVGLELQLGWSRDEIVGDPVYDVLVPADRASHRLAALANLRRNDWWTGETTLKNVDGVALQFTGFCYPVWVKGVRKWRTVVKPILSQIAQESLVTPVTRASSLERIFGLGWDPVSTVTEGNSVGDRLWLARNKAQLSKRRLAKLSGVDQGQIRKWENGGHVPTVANVSKLLPYLGGTLDDYLRQTPSKDKDA